MGILGNRGIQTIGIAGKNTWVEKIVHAGGAENGSGARRMVEFGEIFVSLSKVPSQSVIQCQVWSYAIGILEEQPLPPNQLIEIISPDLLHIIIRGRNVWISAATGRDTGYPPGQDRI